MNRMLFLITLAAAGVLLAACQQGAPKGSTRPTPVTVASLDETFGGEPAAPVPTSTPIPTQPPPTPFSGPPAPTTNYGPAPEIDADVWLNVDAPLRLADLRGKVALIEFWTYG